MTRRDHAAVGGLVLVLAMLVTAVAGPDLVATPPRSTPAPEVPELRPLRQGVLGGPVAVSPLAARTQVDRDLVALVFSGLVRLGPAGSYVPDLAVSWSSTEDGRSWTFRLRDDARWHDGMPVTAEDVVFTIETLRDPSYAGPGGESWRAVEVTAVGERTVRFDLETPLAGFLDAARQPIAPAHLLRGVPVTELETAPFATRPVGSGPFALVALDGERAILRPAVTVLPTGPIGDEDGRTPGPTDALLTPPPTTPPNGPVPGLAGIDVSFYAEAAQLVAAYRSGEVDVVAGLAPGDAQGLAEEPGTRVLRYPGSTLTAISVNLRPTRTVFRDPRVRRALLAAIDRDAIISSVFDGRAARADAPIPPTSWAFDAGASKPVAHDPAAARSVLEDAGWKAADAGWTPSGATSPVAIELLSPDEASNPLAFRVAESVAADWQALGLGVRHVGLPPAELVAARLTTGDYDAAVVDMNIGLDPDLYPLLASTQARTGGSNLAGLQDPELDPLLVAARRPGTTEDRRAAYRALQARLAERQYVLPIAFRDVVVIARETLEGPSVRQVADPGDRYWDVLTWRLAVDR